MQNKKVKRMLAGMLTATLVLGMSITSFAQTGDATGNGTGTGSGEFEGHVDKDVVAVTLPTSTTTTFAYKMDPEGLIAATNNGKYSDASFEEGKNVYFLSGENTYTSESAKLKVINKGTMDVDVTVTAKTAENDNIAMSTDSTFAEDDTAAKLYLGLLVADKAAVAIDTTDDTGKVTVGLKGNADNYEVTATESGYEFAAKAGVPDAAWNSFEFGLTGACNPNGDYSAEDLAAADVTVTWSYVVRADDSGADMLDENAAAGPQVTLGTDGIIRVTNLDGSLWKSMSLNDGTKDWPLATGKDGVWEWEDAEDGKKEFTLGSNWMPDYLKGKTATVKVTLTDGSTLESPSVTFPE